MTAQDEYAKVRNQAMLDLIRDPREVVYAADAVIAEKDAEIARLRLRGCNTCALAHTDCPCEIELLDGGGTMDLDCCSEWKEATDDAE